MMKSMKRGSVAAVALVGVAALALTACSPRGGGAEPADGAAEDTTPIVVGVSWPLSGPAASVAPGVAGLETYIEETNAAGGIDGHPVELVVADDAYDPARLVENQRKFVEKDGALLVVNFGGISIAGRDYLKQKGIAGLSLAANSALGDVENYPLQRAFWPDVGWEGQLQADWITEQNPDAVVGYVGFNNDLSESQLAGLAEGGVVPAEEALVAPGTSDLSAQVSQFQAAGVDTLVVNIGAPTVGALLGYIHQIGWEPTLMLGSTTSDFAAAINQAGPDAVEGAYAFKWYMDPADPLFAEEAGYVAYAKAMTEQGHEAEIPDSLAMNGYGMGAAIVGALEQAETLDSEGFAAAWDSLSDFENPLTLPGITFDSGPAGRILFDFQLSKFDGTSWQPEGEIVDVRDLGIAE